MVYVDGRRFAELTPLYRAPIGSGNHQVKIYNPDRRAYSPLRSVLVRPGQTQVIGFSW
jgi:hypothetical protein